jgi:hypothetical protein
MTRETPRTNPDAPTPNPGVTHLWMPPARLRRYQWSKLIGGALVGSIFAGWLVLQWSSPAMRVLAVALIAVTAWVVVHSWLTDARRARGRQVTLSRPTSGSGPISIRITEPGLDNTVPLERINRARWRDDQDSDAGLWLLGQNQEALVHLDLSFLADEVEARSFLGWLRRCSDAPIPADWPTHAAGTGINEQPAIAQV